MKSENTRPNDSRAVAMAVGGAALAGFGLARRSPLGVLMAAAGGALAYYGAKACGAAGGPAGGAGLTGKARALYEVVGAGVTAAAYDDMTQEAKERRNPAGTLIEDMVDEASDDSFPASDPPAWTAR